MTPFAVLDIARVAGWVRNRRFEDWPQQQRLADGQPRPAMITDLAWNGFGEATEAIARAALRVFEGCHECWRAISVVMPGHSIPTHRDDQPDEWLCRVHVPIMTNDQALFIVNDAIHRLELGRAYQIDTRDPHSVVNAGNTPRVHLMIDVAR